MLKAKIILHCLKKMKIRQKYFTLNLKKQFKNMIMIFCKIPMPNISDLHITKYLKTHKKSDTEW